MICDNCKEKKVKHLCVLCFKKYISTQVQLSKKNARESKQQKALESTSLETSFFVAVITEVLCEDEEVIITYLRSHDYLEDTFINTDLESERDFIIPISQIVMKLPKPNTHRRGKHFFFTSKINLKNIKY